jgi:hypothetical protein
MEVCLRSARVAASNAAASASLLQRVAAAHSVVNGGGVQSSNGMQPNASAGDYPSLIQYSTAPAPNAAAQPYITYQPTTLAAVLPYGKYNIRDCCTDITDI